MDINEKLRILSDAAKYDVSCSSSGSNRNSKKGQLGSVSTSGICHSFTPDGRCISLLKILLTNYCIYDCTYCLNRKSNDIERAAFTVDEIVSLTINFYRRNYIEGLFLSSAIFKNANHTMEMLTNVVDKLRNSYNFRGYIHLKAIPGADESLIKKAGTLVDRMSVNLELPSNDSLKLLAPEKNKESIFTPMKSIKNNIILYNDERKKFKSAPLFVPGGQSTQLIVGATKESDYNILKLSENLYNKFSLKRVYYSAYVPVNTDKNLPSIKNPPTLREHRLYQGDWLLRLYGFKADELLDNKAPNFDINFDPKTNWAINNIHLFPVEINKAPYETLIRIPGIGIRGAKKILSSRRISSLDFEDLKKLGVVLKRAQYFITCKGKYFGSVDIDGDKIKKVLSPKVDLNIIDNNYEQLSFFDNNIALSPSFNKLSLLKDKNSSIIGEI
ncbi:MULTISPECIES: putative DNA modification/repair radical SAM protein [Clostridium]|uniref:DNA-binding protein n=1 Tax=Clostridium disporicum TaxID=84024 RepID=A0A174JSD4_9CLOT|nr:MULTISPECIES: putative DNA modification/repair radical SAM protein [Clostridium]MCD2501716.1 putative DNA modification/repair radical SAM protein [Clostridium sp. NSJ-145]CUP01106.1 DNA-binding protein [Clostridium disporicum]